MHAVAWLVFWARPARAGRPEPVGRNRNRGPEPVGWDRKRWAGTSSSVAVAVL